MYPPTTMERDFGKEVLQSRRVIGKQRGDMIPPE